MSAVQFSLLNMNFSERLQKALDESGKSQADLARYVGVSKSSVTQWLKGPTKKLAAENLLKAAKFLGVSPQWLQDEFGPMRQARGQGVAVWDSPEDLPDGEFAMVKRKLVNFSGGCGTEIFEEEDGTPLAFSSAWIRKKGVRSRDLVIVNIQGDSMEPTISEGEVVLVDMADRQVRDGLVYALKYGNDCKVKRLNMRYDGALVIHSDNASKHPPETVPKEDLETHIQVFGRVIWHGGEM